MVTTDPIMRGYFRLLCAVVLRACRDCQSDDPLLSAEARRWLAEEGAMWAVEIGLDPGQVTGWVAGLEALPWEQLALGI